MKMDIFCNVNPVNPSKKIKDEKEQQPLCGVDVPFLNLRGLTLVGIDIISSVTLFIYFFFFVGHTKKIHVPKLLFLWFYVMPAWS